MRHTSTFPVPLFAASLAGLFGLGALTGCNKANNNDDTDTDTDTEYVQPWTDGCIVSSDGKTFELLDDAVVYADDGSTLTLCPGTFEASIALTDKTYQLVGDTSGDPTVWVAPINQAALTVTSGSVTLSDVEIQSTRSGVVIEGGTVGLTRVTIPSPGNYGVSVATGDVSLDSVVIDAPNWGGVKVEGGTVAILDSTITGPQSYGVYVEGGATVNIERTLIRDAAYVNSEAYLFDADGAGVWAKGGATVVMADNTILANAVSAVQIESGTLTMNGDVIDGELAGFTGLLWRNSVVELTDVTIANYAQYGVFAESSHDVTLTNVAITTDPEQSAQQILIDESTNQQRDGSIGLRLVESSVVWDGGEVSGNNGAGILGSTTTAVGATVDLRNLLVTDNARFGVAQFNAGEIVMTDVDVVNTRNEPLCEAPTGGYSCDMAVVGWQADVTTTGGSVTDSGRFGWTILAGRGDITGTTFSRNENFGVYGESSAVTVTDALFDEGRQYGLYSYDGSAIVRNTTFQNGHYEQYSEYTSGDTTYGYLYYDRAVDVFAYSSTLDMEDCTFVDGDRGVQGSSSDVAIRASSFSGLNSLAAYIALGSMTIDHTTFDDIGTNFLSCSSDAEAALSDVNITDIHGAENTTDYFIDGVYQNTSTYTSNSYGIYGYRCDLRLDDVRIEGVVGTLMYGYDSTLDFDGVEIVDTGESGYSNWGVFYMVHSGLDSDGDGVVDAYNRDPEVVMNDVLITGEKTTHALNVVGVAGATGGEVRLEDVRLGLEDNGSSGIAGSAIQLSYVASVILNGIDIDTTGENAIEITGGSASITGTSTASSGTISSAGANGISATNANMTLSGLTIDASTTDGIYLSGGTHTVSDVTVTTSGSWGLECVDGATLTTCSNASFEGDAGSITGCTCGAAE